MDDIEIVFEEDGTISVETDKVSPVNHRNADDTIRLLKRQQGGNTAVKTKQPHSHKHSTQRQKVGQ